jgi:hypothetical protein
MYHLKCGVWQRKRVYQEFLARSLTEKYNDLNSQADKMIHDANAEISGLRDKMDSLSPKDINSTAVD